MTPARLLVSTAFTMLGGWLMVDPEASVSRPVRDWLANTVRAKTDAAALAVYDGAAPSARLTAWETVGERLTCRICMGLEWSLVAWVATRQRGSRTGLLRTVVEVGAINGAHLLAVKLSTRKGD